IPVLDEELFQHGTDSGDLRFGPSPSDPLTPIIGNRLFSAVVVVKQKAVGPMLQQRQVPRILRVVAKVPLVVIHLASPRLQEPANANPGVSGCPQAATPALGVRVKI